MKNKYTNRYGDEFIFTKLDDGNILWEGNFEYIRVGYPNVYTVAYAKYTKSGGKLPIDEFIKKIHKGSFKKYQPLVFSDKSKIDMVDPSGGPFISSGMNLSCIGFDGLIADSFEKVDNNYKIIIK